MQTFDDIGVGIPEIYLPSNGIDLTKWAVIACDQFTSEPEYWRQVSQVVGEAPSTLRLVLPEIDLGAPDKAERIGKIQAAMEGYIHTGKVVPSEGMIYVERRVDGKLRRGLVLSLDLEQYDFTEGSTSLIRATEGTIVERLHPRMAIREGAALELPHILVLIDDPGRTVIEPVGMSLVGTRPLYDFDLMLGSGRLTGYAMDGPQQNGVITALRNLALPERFREHYGLGDDMAPLLFAMGDGNHSLATAKAVWEKMKAQVGPRHPARYALVEIENIHDEALNFEPIHRVLFNTTSDLLDALAARFGSRLSRRTCASFPELIGQVDAVSGPTHAFGLISGAPGDSIELLEVSDPDVNLPAGTLQPFLDAFMEEGGAARLDYVHGVETLQMLGEARGNAGFYLPPMQKSSLFKTVILDGTLPRKTFSLGEAREKRFYMEARRIS